MARRPTIEDVAREAGVSVATVDRVLNNRARVREETARRVSEAAAAVGYHAAGLIARQVPSGLPELRLGFVLHKRAQSFWQQVEAAVEAAAAGLSEVRAKAVVEWAPGQSPQDFATAIEALGPRVDALAATAIAHTRVTDAVLRVTEGGVPCFALFNDFAQGVRQSYVGLNNMKVGRIAASMIDLASREAGTVAVFVGGYRWHGHELREAGFRSYLREYAPQLRVLDTLVNLETRRLTYEATLDLLDRHRDLRGLYVAGGGMEGAIAALRESRRPGDVALVVNELTPESRDGLTDRLVSLAIATPVGAAMADVARLMADAVLRGAPEVKGQHFVAPVLHIPESV